MSSLTAWDIYWVMQLDSISITVSLLGIIAAIVAAIATFIGCMNRSLYNDFPEYSDKELKTSVAAFRISSRVAPVAVLLLLGAGFIPSTRTAAAMVVIPAIANNETIKKEAGDLYGLAKEALTRAAKGDEK